MKLYLTVKRRIAQVRDALYHPATFLNGRAQKIVLELLRLIIGLLGILAVVLLGLIVYRLFWRMEVNWIDAFLRIILLEPTQWDTTKIIGILFALALITPIIYTAYRKERIIETFVAIVAFLLFVLIFVRGSFGAEAIWMDRFLGTSGLREAMETAVKWETIKTLGQTLFALVLTFGIYAAYKRAIASDKIAQAQHDDNEQKIFNEATTKLGDKSASVRLGGIYGLYNLARLKKKEHLKNITEILCAHLRETTQRKKYKEKHKIKPSNEIQSLLRLLSKLNDLNERDEQSVLLRLDLSASYLVGAHLSGTCLGHADLSEANMQGASLREAQLQGASLGGTQLQRAALTEAQLQGAVLDGAQLQGADLWGAQLQGTSLGETQLQGAVLTEARLQGAVLGGAQLQGAVLTEAQLQGAILAETQLQGAALGGAQLQGVELNKINLHGAYSLHPVGRSLSLTERIRARQGKETELTIVIFSGGLKEEDALSIRKKLAECQRNGWMTKKDVDKINKLLVAHQDKPAVTQLPKGSGAITGVFTKEEADTIITEYEAAMAGEKKTSS